MDVDNHTVFFACAPNRVIRRGVNGVDASTRGKSGDEDPTGQAVSGDPLDVCDGVVDVVEKDLPDPGATSWDCGTPVGQPSIVCSKSRESKFIFLC